MRAPSSKQVAHTPIDIDIEAGDGWGHIVSNHPPCIKICVSATEANRICGNQKTRENNCRIFEVEHGDNRMNSKMLLVERQADEDEGADNNQGNDPRGLPKNGTLNQYA